MLINHANTQGVKYCLKLYIQQAGQVKNWRI